MAALARAGVVFLRRTYRYMKADQFTESVHAGHGRSVGRQPQIDQDLGLTRPFLGVVAA